MTSLEINFNLMLLLLYICLTDCALLCCSSLIHDIPKDLLQLTQYWTNHIHSIAEKNSLIIVKRSFSLSLWNDLGVCAEALDSEERLGVFTGLDEVFTCCGLIILCLSYSSTRSKTQSFASKQLMLWMDLEQEEPCSLNLLCC